MKNGDMNGDIVKERFPYTKSSFQVAMMSGKWKKQWYFTDSDKTEANSKQEDLCVSKKLTM